MNGSYPRKLEGNLQNRFEVIGRSVCWQTRGLDSKETVVLHRWGRETQNFGFINYNNNNNNNNIYPGSPLALAVFSGALQFIIKMKN